MIDKVFIGYIFKIELENNYQKNKGFSIEKGFIPERTECFIVDPFNESYIKFPDNKLEIKFKISSEANRIRNTAVKVYDFENKKVDQDESDESDSESYDSNDKIELKEHVRNELHKPTIKSNDIIKLYRC